MPYGPHRGKRMADLVPNYLLFERDGRLERAGTEAETAVREYVDRHREELERAALNRAARDEID